MKSENTRLAYEAPKLEVHALLKKPMVLAATPCKSEDGDGSFDARTANGCTDPQ